MSLWISKLENCPDCGMERSVRAIQDSQFSYALFYGICTMCEYHYYIMTYPREKKYNKSWLEVSQLIEMNWEMPKYYFFVKDHVDGVFKI